MLLYVTHSNNKVVAQMTSQKRIEVENAIRGMITYLVQHGHNFSQRRKTLSTAASAILLPENLKQAVADDTISRARPL